MTAAPGLGLDLRALARSGPVHFVGIAGAGMSALAELVLRAGGRVTGCDANPGAAGVALRARGVEIQGEHSPAHVQNAVAVVATAAVPADHPELAAARARGIPVLKRAQALGAIVNRGTLLAIAGTHGKTTTTAMTTAILIDAGLDPTAFVGGTVGEWGSGLRAGAESLFVVEADEYDRSFFALRPTVAVVTSVEPDHLDVYGTAAAVEEAFVEFVSAVPPSGLLAACTDDPGAARTLSSFAGPRLSYGIGQDAELRAEGVRLDGRASEFTVRDGARVLGPVRLGVPGLHNVRNALGAFAAARFAGAGFAAAQSALPEFRGVTRRLEELGRVAGVVVVDDYAHHPTEIEASIAACRVSYPGRRLIAAFQPHLFSRTRDFAAAFGVALAHADEVWVTDVYAAREAPVEGVSGALVADAARSAGAPAVRFVASLGELAAELVDSVPAGSVCLMMGAGDIDGAARQVLERLQGREGE